MEFKLINIEQVNKLYPNNYNEDILKEYKLFDKNFNNSFCYCYSFYKFYLNEYLRKNIDLVSLEEKIAELNLGISTKYLYKDISSLKEKYVFIRNNVFLDRLKKDEFDSLAKCINNKNYKDIYEIVKNTYKKVIVFDQNFELDSDVLYEIDNPLMMTKNNALVIGILLKDNNKELDEFIKLKENEYSQKLGIPVSILIYTEELVKSQNVFVLENLNEMEEQYAKEELKKYPKYLPIGSVVMLKGAWKKLMITGYAPLDPETNKILFDYMACLYPEGIVKNDYNLFFNHSQIKKIYAIGLKDEEQEMFMKEILSDKKDFL